MTAARAIPTAASARRHVALTKTLDGASTPSASAAITSTLTGLHLVVWSARMVSQGGGSNVTGYSVTLSSAGTQPYVGGTAIGLGTGTLTVGATFAHDFGTGTALSATMASTTATPADGTEAELVVVTIPLVQLT